MGFIIFCMAVLIIVSIIWAALGIKEASDSGDYKQILLGISCAMLLGLAINTMNECKSNLVATTEAYQESESNVQRLRNINTNLTVEMVKAERDVTKYASQLDSVKAELSKVRMVLDVERVEHKRDVALKSAELKEANGKLQAIQQLIEAKQGGAK